MYQLGGVHISYFVIEAPCLVRGVYSALWLDGRSEAPEDAAVLSFCRSPLLGPTCAVILTRLPVNK